MSDADRIARLEAELAEERDTTSRRISSAEGLRFIAERALSEEKRAHAATKATLADVEARLLAAQGEAAEMRRERDTPELFDFTKAVVLEAQHQRARWDTGHDAGKTDADWFWLIGYLAGKALHNPGVDRPTFNHTRGDSQFYPCDICRAAIKKQLHRIITVAAVAANWHAARLGKTNMRPGIEPPVGEGG